MPAPYRQALTFSLFQITSPNDDPSGLAFRNSATCFYLVVYFNQSSSFCHLEVVMCYVYVFVYTDSSQSQYLQAEDRGNKLKQLLVQTKKDLADSKKRVHSCAIFSYHGCTPAPFFPHTGTHVHLSSRPTKKKPQQF